MSLATIYELDEEKGNGSLLFESEPTYSTRQQIRDCITHPTTKYGFLCVSLLAAFGYGIYIMVFISRA